MVPVGCHVRDSSHTQHSTLKPRSACRTAFRPSLFSQAKPCPMQLSGPGPTRSVVHFWRFPETLCSESRYSPRLCSGMSGNCCQGFTPRMYQKDPRRSIAFPDIRQTLRGVGRPRAEESTCKGTRHPRTKTAFMVAMLTSGSAPLYRIYCKSEGTNHGH